MESAEKWYSDFIALKLLDKKTNSKKNDAAGVTVRHPQQTFKFHSSLQYSIPRSECGTGSCPDLQMSKIELAEQKLLVMAGTPQLPVRTHRPLCLSVSSDSNGRYKPLESQGWQSNLKAQMDQVGKNGSASSTGSLERASLFCATGSPSSCSSLSSPSDSLTRTKSSSRFSLFSPPWNSSSESDSSSPSRSGSKKFRNCSKKGAAKAEEGIDSHQIMPEHFHYSEPVMSKVTDYIYVGNINAAYSGRILCKNHIDSIIDMSDLSSQQNVWLIPCTCSQDAKHSWSRLKIHLNDSSTRKGDNLKQCCFEDIIDYISASVEKKKRVLIHCRDGYSLAPTCIIQYLMLKQNMTLMAAYEFVRARYPVNIKECHQNLLVSLEKSLRPGNIDPECFKQALSRKVAWT
ncbi:uncharacterized protein LOC122791259 [Protopterus annectens]|uniref:uncharacterized protein LOC122791259 n=1 Tax=Protopterus annectens TaxID=7888 RepID=UPI001CFBD721|nr:uncharacterized protein LOC122791259 [Protopterus annectens]